MDANLDIIRMLLVSAFQRHRLAQQGRQGMLLVSVFLQVVASMESVQTVVVRMLMVIVVVLDVNMESARMVGVRLLQRIIVGA